MGRASTLPKKLQPMLATLTDGPFDDPGWIFEDKYDGFRMVAKIESGKVTLYSRNGQIISRNYIEVARALKASWQTAQAANICRAPARTIGSRSKPRSARKS